MNKTTASAVEFLETLILKMKNGTLEAKKWSCEHGTRETPPVDGFRNYELDGSSQISLCVVRTNGIYANASD